MNSAQIQQAVYEWAQAQNFTAPYGILLSDGTSKNGKPYKSVTFGRARTLDANVNIYNRNFMTVETNRHGRVVVKSYDELMAFLKEL